MVSCSAGEAAVCAFFFTELFGIREAVFEFIPLSVLLGPATTCETCEETVPAEVLRADCGLGLDLAASTVAADWAAVEDTNDCARLRDVADWGRALLLAATALPSVNADACSVVC